MTKKLVIIATAILGVGLIIVIAALISLNFKINSIGNQTKKLTQEYEITNETTLYIDAKTADIDIKKSLDDKVHIFYTEAVNCYSYNVSYSNDKIEIVQIVSPRQWMRIFTLNFFTEDNVVIELPEIFISDITVKLSTGDLDISNIYKVDNIDVSLTTGEVELNNFDVNNLDIKTTTGQIDLSHTNITNDTNLIVSTGEIELTSVTTNTLRIVSTTGDVEFETLNANSITITTTTGRVKGKFSESINNYKVTSKTSTGKNSLPSILNSEGEKTLNVTTTTGNIAISFNDYSN